MKRKLYVFLAMLLVASMAVSVCAAASPVKIFPDVGNHWAKEYIERLTEMGIVHGYPDGTCRPDGTITRAEFASLLSHTLELDTKEAAKNSPTFADVKGSWAEGHIEALVTKGIIIPADYPNGFNPNGDISRMEIAKMTVNAIGKGNEARSIKHNTGFLDDKDIKEEDKGYVIVAKNYGLVYGYTDNTFKPENSSTRAEAMALIIRMLDVLDKSSTGHSGGGKVHYPDAVVSFELPEFTYTDKTIELTVDKKNVKSLTWNLKKQADDMSMAPADLSAVVDGSLDENGGTIRFHEQGRYELIATAANNGNSKFEFTKAITIYPIPVVEFTLPANAHTDETVTVTPSATEVGSLDILWSLTKDGEAASWDTYIDGILDNNGGILCFKDKGEYTLTATVTDEVGRVFTHSASIKVYQIPVVEFTLPAHAHTDTPITITTVVSELGTLNIAWTVSKDSGNPVAYNQYLNGSLTNMGGAVTFTTKGSYLLSGKVTDATGRVFIYDAPN